MLAGKEIALRSQRWMPQRHEGSDQFANRIFCPGGDQFQRLSKNASGLILAQSKIKHCQRAIHASVIIFIQPIFLHAETNVPPMDFQVGFNHPLLSVDARALKQKRVRPVAPGFVGIEMPLRACNRFIDDARSAARQSDSAGQRMGLKKFAIGNSREGDDLVHIPTGKARIAPSRHARRGRRCWVRSNERLF